MRFSGNRKPVISLTKRDAFDANSYVANLNSVSRKLQLGASPLEQEVACVDDARSSVRTLAMNVGKD